MYICLICSRSCKNRLSLSVHLRRAHGIGLKEYNDQYHLGFFRYCEKCGVLLSKNCSGNHCDKHRERSGEKNPFYGKTHSSDVISLLREKCQESSRKKWEDPDYRRRVIKGVSKPRRESFSREQSERIKLWYSENPHQRDQRRETMKNSWANGTLTFHSHPVNRSKAEELIFLRLKEVFPSLVRRETLRLSSGKYLFPDISVGESLIIEYHGDFWHANPNLWSWDDPLFREQRAIDRWYQDSQRLSILKSQKKCVWIFWQEDYEKNPSLFLDRITEAVKHYLQGFSGSYLLPGDIDIDI